MRAIDLAFERKNFPRTHVSLGALKDGLNAKVDRKSFHWNAEIELDR